MTDSHDSVQASQDLRIVDLTKRFGAATAVDDISLTVPAGSFFALLGPSGCGKTTTLRMVAGLEDPTAGAIYLGDEDVTYRKPYKRPVNTVFQNYALFPHLDVFDNVAFGLRRRGIRGVDKQVNEMLELVELGGYGGRKPAQLSGGQQQRVALARALINRPQVLLLDEPLGALDLKLRRQMQLELKRIQTEVGITFVHVTHDQEEAMTMADTIAVMNEGKVEQLGAPEELYENPCTVFVANFLGQSNLLTATVTGHSGDELLLDVAGNKLSMPVQRRGTGSDQLYVGIRPEKIRLRHADDPADPGGRVTNEVTGVITDTSFTGVSTQYLVRTGWGQELMVYAPNLEHDGRLRPGAPVVLSWNPAHTFGLEATGNVKAGMDEDALEVASATASS
ncbi:MAG: spermidine/putrescine transport system ATP-binding protein [Frankiales bacterium]|jgi:spermidine/putrescine transport system ATP-binding protein|nr:spermidine/putrescine transport system ATP-binding protein [Frankiales bacterium]